MRRLASVACDHATMLTQIKTLVLFTRHFHACDEHTSVAMGALSDLQGHRAHDLVEGAGQDLSYRDFPEAAHSMYAYDPECYTETLVQWASALS